jgi:hypothetical protein
MKDSEIIHEDAGNGKIKITIKFPNYFKRLDIQEQRKIIKIIEEASKSGLLNNL